MITKTEIPDNIGLIYYRTDGSLRTARKAVQTEPDIELMNSMLRYLVYYRTGSDRQQIAAAYRQVQMARRSQHEAEQSARHYREAHLEAMSKIYKLRKMQG